MVLDLGGQVAVYGTSVPVGFADPGDRGALADESGGLLLTGGSVATSGHSERSGHLLDPRDGQPAADFGSLTVRASSAALADCLSTGLYVLGPEAAVAWADDREDIDVIVLAGGLP